MASRFRKRLRALAGRALIVSGQATEYLAPAVAGYFGGAGTAVAGGAVLGVAGEAQIASGRRLAGKKRQNVRVKVEQGAVRGAAIGAAGYGARTLIDYINQPGTSNNPTTQTIGASTPGGSSSTQAAKPITLTKAGSTVEFNTDTGAATLKGPSGSSVPLDTKGILSGSAPALAAVAAGLLGQPGGQEQTKQPGFLSDLLGGGGGDPTASASAGGEGTLSPIVLGLIAVVFLFLVL